MDTQIPKVKSPKWFNSDIRHCLNCLHILRRKYKKSYTKSVFIRKYSTKKIYCAKTSFEIDSMNPSKIYKYFNDITGHNKIPVSVYESTSATSDLFIINQYFHSLFTQSSFILPPITDLPISQHTCSDIVTIEEEVFCEFTSLDPSKAAGCDKISPRFLGHRALTLCQPFHHLFSLSLHQSYIPAEWRMYLITPIFKSGDISAVDAISLLCVISNVLERLVYRHLSDFVSESLSPVQYGFQQKHNKSTLHC